jgi:hypothetical protein
MAIFGISIFDNLGFEFINNFMNEVRFITFNIIEYLSHTRFFQFINKLFFNKEINIINTKDDINHKEVFDRNKIENKNNITIEKPTHKLRYKEPVISRMGD